MATMEQEELINRTQAMEEDEIRLALKAVPTDYLWEEMLRRDTLMREMLGKIGKIMKGGSDSGI